MFSLFRSALLCLFLLMIGFWNESLYASKVYVLVNSSTNNVQVINLSTNTVVAHFSIQVPVNALVASHDTTKVYVTAGPTGQPGTVTVFNAIDDTIITTITVGQNPTWIAISPDGSRLYTSNLGDKTVSVIDTATNSVIATIAIPGVIFPEYVIVSPDGTRVYVSDRGNGLVSVINATTNTFITNVVVGVAPRRMVITPDGSKVYIVLEGNTALAVLDTATNTSSSIPFPAGDDSGNFIVITPDGSRVYVTNNGSNTVTSIDVATNSVIGSAIPVGNNPQGITVSLDATQVFVANDGDGTVSVIDIATNTVVNTLTPGLSPFVLGFDRETGKLVITNDDDDLVSIVSPGSNTSVGVEVFSNQTYIAFVLELFPPTNGKAKQKRCRFLTQTEVTNILTWRAPIEVGEPAVRYLIFNNVGLINPIGSVNANEPLLFQDFVHNCKKRTFTYYVVAQDAAGNLSSPLIITLNAGR